MASHLVADEPGPQAGDDLFGAEAPLEPAPLPEDAAGSDAGVEEEEAGDEAEEGEPASKELSGDILELAKQKVGNGDLIPTVRLMMFFGWTEPETMPDAKHLGIAFDCLPSDDRMLLCLRAGIGIDPKNDFDTARALRTKKALVAGRVKAATEKVAKALKVVATMAAKGASDCAPTPGDKP